MIYFISGHRDLTYEQFEKLYIPIIDKVLMEDRLPYFMIGDCEGADAFAIHYLIIKKAYMSVFHLNDCPQNISSYLRVLGQCGGFINFRGGYKSDIERDEAMTELSNFDIAVVLNNRWNSGTAQNILRRHAGLK